ncbi:MAG: heavy-metal-associated domain-containing protein [Nitrospirae bacterium]|nr:heavy-metal-associated domain-containing protein [Nitrospirota bacterium]
MTEITLRVAGMSCGHCVNRIKKALDSIKGVAAADVQIGTVKVSFDESIVSCDQIASAITNAGYEILA